MIGVIDYGGGNLRNVLNVLKHLDVESDLVASPDDFHSTDRVLFPGVGAMGDCMRVLEERGLTEPLRQWIAEDRPYFGICLGYQVLFEASEESSNVHGLGAFQGRVVKFPGDTGLKVPHMGWNAIQRTDPEDPIWTGVADDAHVYFVHSFYPQPEDEAMISSRTEYGVEFASSIRKGNTFACQFHPERSQQVGLQLIKNFAHG